MRSGFSVFIFLGAFSFTTLSAINAAFARDEACSCAWDNTTKDYPENSKTEGTFSTTVRYRCGYLCKDSSGQVQHVIGDHQVTYRGQEAGNEVVCEGLRYESHENPTGSFGRWILYMWDGITYSFDARTSKSPTVRGWSQNSCSSAPPVTATAVSPREIDGMRATVGLKLIQSPRAAFAKVAELSEDLKSVCKPNTVQAEFLQGKIHSSLNETCSIAQEKALLTEFESLRTESFRLKSLEQTKGMIGKLQRILLCPQVLNVSSPAVLRTILDKAVVWTSQEAEATEALKSLACSMAWRGLKKGLLPPGILSK